MAKATPISQSLMTAEDMVNRIRGIVPRGVAELERIINDADASDRDKITAINTVLDRAYGKAGQKVEVTGAEGGALQHAFTVTFVRPE